MTSLTLLVLAAGMGSRYGGLKQIDPVGPNGEAIIDYSIYDALQAGFDKVVFVIRRDIETAFRETVGQRFEPHVAVEYLFQHLDMLPTGFSVPAHRHKPWGTGHAVLVAKEQIAHPFAVINADDFYGSASYHLLADFLRQNPNPQRHALVGYTLRNTLSDHGGVSRGICQVNADSDLIDVIETKKIAKAGDDAVYPDPQGNLQHLSGDAIASMNMFGFMPNFFDHLETLFSEFLTTQGQEPTAEFYIPAAVTTLIERQQATTKMIPSPASWFGMTYKEDKASVEQSIHQLIEQGVYPKKLF